MSNVEPRDDRTEEEGRMAGDPSHTPAEGTAEVHSRITGGGGYSDAERPAGGERSSGEGARETYDELRDRAEDLGDRAEAWVSRTRDRVDETIHSIEGRFDLEHSGVVRMIRENPVLAAGLAFGVGFLLAGGRRGEERSGVVGAATGQLRGALLGGLTAAISQELRDLIDEHGGVGGLLSAFGDGEHELG